MNSRKDAYCYSCGQVLNVAKPQTKVLEEEEVDDDTRRGNTRFDDSSHLLLLIPGAAGP